MSRTRLAPFSYLLLLVSIFTTFTTAIPTNALTARQQQSNLAICSQYSTIANLSTVGANATYRAAYLAASPEGSDPARAPLDAAIPELPSFKFNKTINDECGNLTTLAFKAAAVNFTEGIVLQFKVGVVNAAVQMGASALGLAVVMAFVVGTIGDLL